MTHYRGDPRWITAKYAGKCHRCGEGIDRGSEAFYYPKGKQLYGKGCGCGDAEWRSFESARCDEEVYQGYGNPFAC